jgi:oligopeptide/dipeptide ABC transporter ATP-binding protein
VLVSELIGVPTVTETGVPLVETHGLYKHFPVAGRRLILGDGTHRVIHAVDDANLTVMPGEFLAVVGESGSGKTTLANCIVGFHEPTAGEVLFEGRSVVEAGSIDHPHRPKRSIGREEYARLVQMVFQDPISALNPRMTAGDAVSEPLRVHGLATRADAARSTRELFDLVKIPTGFEHRYPHELNSGQRQRVVIARALALRPKLLVADEPVAKLDVSMQGQVLNLLLELQRDLDMTIIFITHDLSVVRQVATRVAVMYLGRIVEVADADAFFAVPAHPYSGALLASTPGRTLDAQGDIFTISGEIPSPIDLPQGCRFATRCPACLAACTDADPPLTGTAADPDHLSACIRRDDPSWRPQFGISATEVVG